MKQLALSVLILGASALTMLGVIEAGREAHAGPGIALRQASAPAVGSAVTIEPMSGSGSGSAVVEAGSAVPVTTTTTTTTTTALPADRIPDPLSNPAATLDTVKGAKAMGWGVVLLVVLIIISRLLGRLGGVFKRLKEGKAAVVIASVGTLSITAYNALILEGSWLAALLAGVVAGAALWDSQAKPKTETAP